MKLGEQFKSQYLNSLRDYLPQEIVQNSCFEAAVLKNLDELTELSTVKVCEARKKGLGVSCEALVLAERTLKLSSGDEFIAGARFKNLNIHFPFIEIHFGLNLSPMILREIQDIVREEFKDLDPKGLKFKGKPNSYPNLECWSHTVFGRIEKKENLHIPAGLSFSFTKNLDWHSQYLLEYQERLVEKKELEGFVRIAQSDEFQESAIDDALLIASDHLGFSGVVAGINSPIYGLPAIYMIESYLSKRWTGKKVAPIAHTVFLNQMANRYKYVWGTIYDKNHSSLNTALRIGRKIIETEYFVRWSD